jgi:TPR repeat protein
LVLKQRALVEQAAGNKETSLWLSVFSEVAAVDTAAFAHIPPKPSTTGTDILVPVEPRSGAEAAANSAAAFLSHTAGVAEARPRQGSDEPTMAPRSSLPTAVATALPSRGELSGEAVLPGASLHLVSPHGPDADHGMGQGNPEAHKPTEVRASAAPTIEALLQRAAEVLADGDISAARLLFTRAAESGSGKAARALGDTYNPKFLAEHGVQGLRADPESAKNWYLKAVAFGEPQAKQRLLELDTDRPAEAMGVATSR